MASDLKLPTIVAAQGQAASAADSAPAEEAMPELAQARARQREIPQT